MLNNVAIKYNRFLFGFITLAPIIAYITYTFLHAEYEFILRLLSFVGVFLILIFRRESNPIVFPSYLLFYLLFVLYIYYSTFFYLDRDFKIKYLVQDPHLGTFNFMFIIENLKFSEKNYKFILNYSKKILIVAVIVILIQEVYDPGFFVRKDLESYDEVTSWGQTQNRLLSIYSYIGEYLAVGYSFTPLFLIVVEDLQKHKKKILFWLIAGIIFAFFSKARWIMVNTLLVFFLLVVHHKNKARQLTKLFVIVPLLFFTSIKILDFADFNATGIINERILESDKRNMDQRTASTRLFAFTAFNKVFWDQPFFGMGDRKYGMGGEGKGKHDYKLQKILGEKTAQIHVGYLSLLYLYGIVGGFLFLSFSYLQLRRLYQNAKKTKIWAPFLVILGFALGNLTQVHFALLHMGLILALVVDKYHRQKLVEE